MKILIVDDDSIYVMLITKTLESLAASIEVTQFTEGQSALDRLMELRHDVDRLPDIIFLDLNMPVMDGWEFLKEYADREGLFKKNIRIYVVSSSISPADVERARHLGIVVDFLMKPMDNETLAWVSEKRDKL